MLIVWLYDNNGGSVLAAVPSHTMINFGEFLFPNYGSHYDPVLFGLAPRRRPRSWGCCGARELTHLRDPRRG
ncbi:MAG: hypothetical protein LH603_21785 [Pseudonocardia sp.]|nr:hypothetical protein [Pseudonocardia sp.]